LVRLTATPSERAARGIADRAKIKTHPAAGHPPGDAKRNREHGQKQIVIRQRRYEREVEHVSWHSRAAQPDRGAEIFGVGDDQADKFGHRNGRHTEIMAGQSQRRHADDGRNRHARHNAGGNADQRRQREMRIRAHCRVGTASEKHDMTDRNLAGIAADNVPG